jgi:formate dehydrogenase subunit gamma
MTADHDAVIPAIIDKYRDVEGAALPMLHAVQEALGYVPESAIPLIAEALNVTRAEMHGVVTFYHDFRREPAGRHVIKLCRAEACQAAGGVAVAQRISERLGVAFGETSPDGRVTLDAVYCLGLCATAPAAMIDGRVVGRLGPDAADRIVAEVNR